MSARSELTNEQIELAVEFWRRAMEDQKIEAGGERDNDPGAKMVEEVMRAAPDKTDEDSRAAFAGALRVLLMANRDTSVLSVDYDPSGLLLDALHEAGFECSGVSFSAKGLLPIKTVTSFRDGYMEVKYGYGVPWVTVREISDLDAIISPNEVVK